MSTTSLQTQQDEAYDNLAIRQTLVCNKRMVASTVNSNVVNTALLDADSVITSGIVNEGNAVVNGNLDVSGQVSVGSIAVDDSSSDGQNWLINEDATSGNLNFQINSISQMAFSPLGILFPNLGLSFGNPLVVAGATNTQGRSLIVLENAPVGTHNITIDTADWVPGKVIVALTTGVGVFVDPVPIAPQTVVIGNYTAPYKSFVLFAYHTGSTQAWAGFAI